MFQEFRAALKLLLALTVLTGIIYPLVITGVAQLIFPHEANGSLIIKNGKPIGSELIGQYFDKPQYFWGRPSATSPVPYNAQASSGSNQGPLNPLLLQAVQTRAAALKSADSGNNASVPVDLVTASASGLDPQISPGAAQYQVARVAKARGMDEAVVKALVANYTKGRTLGILGEPRVNVLQLNLALDGIGK
jgi:potassium-transporting ATPase KdpC subunit